MGFWERRFSLAFLGTRQIRLAGGSGSVTGAGSRVYIDDVVKALSSANKAILLGVGPLGDGTSDGVIDRGGDCFVIGVFETERSSVLGLSVRIIVLPLASCR